MQVVTRKAIYNGPADSSFKASLINWALPYAQRYIYSAHPDKYSQLKQSGFNNLEQLQVLAVEKLSYHYAIKKCRIASKKQEQCSCLLEVWNEIAYCTFFISLTCVQLTSADKLLTRFMWN